jgi:hypothetical protein
MRANLLAFMLGYWRLFAFISAAGEPATRACVPRRSAASVQADEFGKLASSAFPL